MKDFVKKTIQQYEYERKSGRTVGLFLVSLVLVRVANTYLEVPIGSDFAYEIAFGGTVAVEYVWRKWLRDRFGNPSLPADIDPNQVADQVVEEVKSRIN